MPSDSELDDAFLRGSIPDTQRGSWFLFDNGKSGRPRARRSGILLRPFWKPRSNALGRRQPPGTVVHARASRPPRSWTPRGPCPGPPGWAPLGQIRSPWLRRMRMDLDPHSRCTETAANAARIAKGTAACSFSSPVAISFALRVRRGYA